MPIIHGFYGVSESHPLNFRVPLAALPPSFHPQNFNNPLIHLPPLESLLIDSYSTVPVTFKLH